MSACDPKGVCPRCGYANGPGAERCVRCRSILVVMQGCTGACTKCLSMPTLRPAQPDGPKE